MHPLTEHHQHHTSDTHVTHSNTLPELTRMLSLNTPRVAHSFIHDTFCIHLSTDVAA
jgi:hypothetical protein